MGEGRRVAGVVELAEHLGVAELLPGVAAAELEQPTQECRLVHPGEQEHVAADRGLDQRIEDVPPPAGLVADQRRGPRVAAEEDELVEGDPEGGPHLRERPVRDAEDLEPAGQALGEPLLHEQRRRSEQDHLQPATGAGVLVPQALDGLGPAGGLLDLVDHEHGAGGAGLEACRLPLLRDPLRATERGLVGAHDADRHRQILDHLRDERRLAHLPRARRRPG